jgi:RNA recognition motif-containing protein
MDPNHLFSLNSTIVLAGYSLAWFLVGVLSGRRLSGRAASEAKRSRPRRRPGRSGRVELYVGNLSYDVTEKDLMKAFSRYGKVLDTRVIENRFNGKSKGFGFVQMADTSESGDAIRGMNGKDLKGRKIVVNEAKGRRRS